MTSSYSLIERRQILWAEQAHISLVRAGYTATLNSNLCLGQLNDETRQEFQLADGSELRDVGSRPAKMRALISSSALAVNFFDAWRHVSKAALQQVLGLERPILSLHFEHKCTDYPVPPRTPNLDLLLRLDNEQLVGIESKFTEPYRTPGVDSPLSLRYHPFSEGLWKSRGLSRVQQLVDSLRGEWDYLDAPQLLKHILGLRSERPDDAVRLYYLWFDTGLDDAKKHRAEINRFLNLVDGDVVFVAISYQELFAQVLAVGEIPNDFWARYMQQRYFSGGTTTTD